MRTPNYPKLVTLFFLACAGCTPTIAVQTPDKPIAINLNIKLDADVRIRVEQKAKVDVAQQPEFSVASISATTTSGQTRSLAAPAAMSTAGAIGERYDGYVTPRSASVAPATADLVAQINAERRALYETRAKEEKAPVAAVGMVYANEIAKTAPKGTYFLDASGKWVQI